jgi:hypothetical protein
MEPERKIEKLLRAYARKRRAQVGDPLTLHPATRRLLQGEAARNAPKPGEEDESVSLWELFRRQWAAFLGFTLIIFFGAMLLLPSLSNVKFKEQQAATMSHLKQIGAAAQIAAVENNGKLPATLDALTNHLLADKILTDAENGGRFAYVAGGASLDDLQSNTVLAYSAADNNGRAVLFANGDVQWLNDTRFSEVTNRGLFQLAVANGLARRQPVEAPATVTVSGGNLAAASSISEQATKSIKLGVASQNAGELAVNRSAAPATALDRLITPQTNSVQFASAASHNLAFGLQNSFTNTIAPGNAAPVLANFQVQQNAGAIRVVDQDGSVYDGSLLPENAVAQAGPVPAATPAPVAALPEIQNKDLSAAKKATQAAQNYFFRVAGTNRTLQQNVVFTGNLLAVSSAATNMQLSFRDGGRAQSELTNQLPWSSSRIAGTAVIAGTNNFEINAVPLPP